MGSLWCLWSGILWPMGRVRLFAHYSISLSSWCRLTWRHRVSKMFVRYMLSRVCLRSSQFYQLEFIQCMGFVSSDYPIFLCWSWDCALCIITIIKSEVWIINHGLWSAHETMACAVCLTFILVNYLKNPGFSWCSVKNQNNISLPLFRPIVKFSHTSVDVSFCSHIASRQTPVIA